MAKAKDRQPPYPVIMHGVSGHLSRREANWLFNTPERIGPGLYGELGTYKGRSAVCMAGGMKECNIDAHLISVDSFDNRNMTKGKRDDKQYSPTLWDCANKNITEKRVDSYITLIKSLTVPAAEQFRRQRFDFLFIDADHSYEGCKADFEAWKDLVVSGGEIAFHDAHMESVNRVVEESGWERYDVETISVITKP